MAADPLVEELLKIYGAGSRAAMPGIGFNSPNQFGEGPMRPWTQQEKLTAYDIFKQQWEQDQATAKAHYEFMKTLPQQQRAEYLRAMALTNGSTDAASFDADPSWHAANFLNTVFGKLGAPRDPSLGFSDAKLFFGLSPPVDAERSQ